MTEADVACALARRGEQDLGRGQVRVLLQVVVLDREGEVVPQAVSEFDLLQRILVDAMLCLGVPVVLAVRLQ